MSHQRSIDMTNGVKVLLSDISPEHKKSVPSSGDVLVGHEGYASIFTGDSGVENDRHIYLHVNGFCYADRYDSTWVAVTNDVYNSILQSKKDKPLLNMLPPAETTCNLTDYNIYVINSRSKEPDFPDKSGVSGYDMYTGFTVIARNETEARLLCNSKIADEEQYSTEFWNDSRFSRCELVGKSCINEPEILTSSFIAG